MSDEIETRHFPYVWPTWIAPLLSGDRQCWWAAWFKANHAKYPKLSDRNEGRLQQWKAEHAEFVRDTAQRLRGDGWLVRIEGQNKISIDGKHATVGAKPDIVAENISTDDARIFDCKTGRRKDADRWQVITYIALSTLKGARLYGKSVTGAVVYRDGRSEVTLQDVAAGAPLVFGAIKEVGSVVQPARVPSEDECRDCDIGCCPDRVVVPTETVKTEEF